MAYKFQLKKKNVSIFLWTLLVVFLYFWLFCNFSLFLWFCYFHCLNEKQYRSPDLLEITFLKKYKPQKLILISIFFNSILLGSLGGDDSSRFLLWFSPYYVLLFYLSLLNIFDHFKNSEHQVFFAIGFHHFRKGAMNRFCGFHQIGKDRVF